MTGGRRHRTSTTTASSGGPAPAGAVGKQTQVQLHYGGPAARPAPAPSAVGPDQELGSAGAASYRALEPRALAPEAEREVHSPASIPTGAGAPLDEVVQQRMQRALVADFAGVRVHTGADSAEAARDLGARAFTTGRDIHFGSGEFQPGTREGDRLLAHELTHVAQGDAVDRIARKVGAEGSQQGDAAERHADSQADQAADALHGAAPLPADKIGPHIEATVAKEFGYPMSPKVADAMAINTPAIKAWVKTRVAGGFKADGNTTFYRTKGEMRKGLMAHGLTAEDAESTAENDYGCTLLPPRGDGSIHIRLGAPFRVTLHELMHLEVGMRISSFAVPEGLAEYLSELVLTNFGVEFDAALGPYQSDYHFVKYLVEVFGQKMVLDDLVNQSQEMSRIFKQYAPDPDATWHRLQTKVSERDFAAATKIIALDFVEQRAVGRAREAKAADIASRMTDTQSELDDLQQWSAEATKPVAGRAAWRPNGDHTTLLINVGARQGIRSGWQVEILEGELAGKRFSVVEVMANQAHADLPFPYQDDTRGALDVRLIKP